MFKVQDSNGTVFTVYSVKTGPESTYFLMYIDGKWVWNFSRWYTPCAD